MSECEDERELLVRLAWAVLKLANISGDQNMVQVIQVGLDKIAKAPDISDE